MRLVIQRVSRAAVTVEEEVVGAIEKGLLVFLAIHKDDKEEQIDWFINKLLNLRIFEDSQEKMNLSVQEVGGALLVVSQFTLYANCQKGRRPDFFESAPPSAAKDLYNKFVAALKKEYAFVETGLFAAKMTVDLVNDGPVTIIL